MVPAPAAWALTGWTSRGTVASASVTRTWTARLVAFLSMPSPSPDGEPWFGKLKADPVDESRACLAPLETDGALGVVRQVRAQPSLGLGGGHPLAPGVVLDL